MTDEASISLAQQLLDFLRTSVGSSSLAYANAATRQGGGFSAETYTFELRNPPPELAGPLVLRLMRNDDDARRETVIHRAVAASGFPTPNVRISGSSADGLGRPFLIAEFAQGADALKAWGVRRAFRQIPTVLAVTMAQLHSIDADAIAEELVAVGWPPERLGSNGILTEIEAALIEAAEPALSDRLERLRAKEPPCSQGHVCHGDLHGLNVLVDDVRVTAVLDWELARVTDPECDVARTKVILDMIPGMSSTLLRPLLQFFGRRSGVAFVQRYRVERELDEERVRWWEAAHCLRLVAMVAHQRATGGSSSSDGVLGVWQPVERHLKRRFDQVMAD